ncbi:hypothetical protein J1614_009125 [Plenodomus biglobosus]|nr:hypothetical protein J1614_009125 [Plenodomus biglobosus]
MAHPTHDTDCDADFLNSCINKKKQYRDIFEPLGLYSSIIDARKEPNFLREEENELYKEIKRIAKDFSKSYASIEQLQGDLAQDTSFSNQTLELVSRYGAPIWGRSVYSQVTVSGRHDEIPNLKWAKESDRKRFVTTFIVEKDTDSA